MSRFPPVIEKIQANDDRRSIEFEVWLGRACRVPWGKGVVALLALALVLGLSLGLADPPEPGDEMGHYRLLTGYDEAAQQFVTHDAYQGPDYPVPYAEMEAHWRVFNRAYVVVAEAGRAAELAALIGKGMEAEPMYRSALAVALAEVAEDPEDRYAWFNAGTNYVGLGQHAEAAAAYDRARSLRLPWRMLWYQPGPFEAYLRVGRYQDVIDLANANLRVAKNLEESYYYHALARRALGDEDGARADLRQALRYNPNFAPAAEALRDQSHLSN